jgi:hypothetical protein
VLKMQINKSDRNDAIGIARIMQTGWFKEVHVKDIDSHSVRALAPAAGVGGQLAGSGPNSNPDPVFAEARCSVTLIGLIGDIVRSGMAFAQRAQARAVESGRVLVGPNSARVLGRVGVAAPISTGTKSAQATQGSVSAQRSVSCIIAPQL